MMWIITSVDIASEGGMSYLVASTQGLLLVHGGDYPRPLPWAQWATSWASSLYLLSLISPHFKIVLRLPAFPHLREFCRRVTNPNCWKSVVPSVFCKQAVCVQEEGDGERKGQKRTRES